MAEPRISHRRIDKRLREFCLANQRRSGACRNNDLDVGVGLALRAKFSMEVYRASTEVNRL
jgi:hypothetical protein